MTIQGGFRFEPTPRWIRVKFNDTIVADSKNALLVWKGGGHWLDYYFPREDVKMEYLEDTGRKGGERTNFHVKVGDQTAENGAFSYTAPDEAKAGVKDYVTFRWEKMDHFYEEEEEIFVHPRDPYHRIDTIPSSRHVRIELEGVTVADSKRPFLLFETSLPTRYYLPQKDVNMAYLTPTDTKTACPYKGESSYWSVTVGDKTYKDIVWGYPEPIAETPKIKDLVCFFNEKVDVYVDGELQARPQTAWS